LVTFHQSLPNDSVHSNKVLLEDIFIKQLFDLRLLELMRIVMINDSAAHTLFSGLVFQEINWNIDKIREEIHENME
jgi:hypothetical protein